MPGKRHIMRPKSKHGLSGQKRQKQSGPSQDLGQVQVQVSQLGPSAMNKSNQIRLGIKQINSTGKEDQSH